ncbi:37S ribosomal protein S9, mitochondrial [Chytridiales sp. JEL 0842]|nr:37S ribosomal protein S9, mitochondrial [Chytridiales sp. JEL 0842]
MKVNALMRKHNIPFQDKSIYGTIGALPRWMSKLDLSGTKHVKLTDRLYDELIHKFNALYTVQDKDKTVERLLTEYLRPGSVLTPHTFERPSLDEFGRSHTRGSRKSARAQCWMVPGDGEIYVNGVHMARYFSDLGDRQALVKPFEATGKMSDYNVWAIVKGGGPSGQADAVAVAVARSLAIHDPSLETILKTLGMLKIDRRQVERKKTGQPKARKKNAWLKR